MGEEKKVQIKQPFREQYTLTIESEVNAINALILSTIELRYDLQVLEIREDYFEARLLVLDNKIISANNPMVKEVAQVSQVFGRMYNELHLHISYEGKVLKVLNTDLILSKWDETKDEMKKYISATPEMEQTISMNDAIFNSPEKVKIAVQANEFFAVYFGQVFNEELPKVKRIPGTNIFNTANLEWDMSIEEMSAISSENIICITVNSHPVRPFSEGYINAAYHQFKDKVDVDYQKVKMYQREDRYIDRETGKLNESVVKKLEEIEPQKLFQKFSFKMISDTEKRKQEEKKNAVKVAQTPEPPKPDEATKPEIYKVVDGKEMTYAEWKAYEERQWQIYQEKKKKKGLFGF